jgi:ligand-binding sensor domain-containing protein
MRNFKLSKKQKETPKSTFIPCFLFFVFIFPFSIFHFPFEVSSAGIGDWTTYTNMNEVQQVLLNNGDLWCATTGGVAILNLNGRNFTKLNNVDGLGGNYLYSLAVDSTGSFWFGAQNGTLTKHLPKENSWKVYNFIDRDGSRLQIKDIMADGEQLWIATNKALSLFLINKHGGEIKETYRRLGENLKGEEEVTCVHLVGDKIWAGLTGGVAFANKNDPNLLDFSRWTSFTKETSLGLGSNSVYSLTDIDGAVIIGTEKGVFKFISSDSGWQSIGLGDRIIKDLKYVNPKLYAATNAGIYVYENQTWDSIPTSGLLTSNFNSLTFDQEGTRWGGTADQGISVYDGSEWNNYVIDGPPANIFADMEIDDDGNLWCAQERYRASVFDGTGWTSLASIPEIDNNWIKTVKMDDQGNLWFSSWGGGLIKYDHNKTWIRYTEKNSPLRGIADHPDYVVVNDIAVDEVGNRWFLNREALDSTRVLCLPVQKDTSWVVFYYDQDRINSNNLLLRVFVKEGHLFVCSQEQGLFDYNYNWTPENKTDDQVTHFTSQTHHLSDGAVTSVNVDKDGTLWVGTSSGLDQYDPDFERFRAVRLPDPLGPQVNDIAVDERNNKWISTSNGLGMMNSKGEFTQVFTTFNSKICGNNVLRLKIDKKTGDVWVGTDNGLSRFESGIGAPAKKLSEVVPFPNPFIIENGAEMLTFDRLPYQAMVRIFTIAGELIQQIKSGNQWNGRNQSGELIASGVYLFYIQGSSGESAVGKIAVIRE